MHKHGAAALLVVLLTAAPVSATSSKPDVLSWPRMRADHFGCMLEKSLGHRDARFNCALKHYENHGDPCHHVDAYVEGPEFPDALASKVAPDVKHIELSWEHGELQSVTFYFGKHLSKAEVLERLRIPAKLPENIESVDLQACSKEGPCLTLVGFDHQGAGDVDCGE